MTSQKATVFMAVAFLFLLTPLSAAAQDWVQAQQGKPIADPLMDRLERVERDMNTLQQYIYRQPQDRVVAPASSSNFNRATEGAPTEDSANKGAYDQRFYDLDQQLRHLTGSMEEMDFRIRRLEENFEKLTKDLDYRLGRLEQGGAAQTVSEENPRNFAAPQISAEAIPDDPKAHYDLAFGFLRQAQYDQAEVYLKSFLDKYPDHELTENAHYWLGETYYVRGQLDQAAVEFLNGYKKYPKGAKAPDNLLKLGLSLAKRGSKDEACKTFGKLLKEFPKASEILLNRARDEQKALSCS